MKRLKILACLIGFLIGPAHAEERITPTCWEEQIKGEVFRHCEVNRAPKPALVPVRPQTASPPPSPPQTAYEPEPPRHWPLPPPPPAYAVDRIPHYGPPAGYYGPLWSREPGPPGYGRGPPFVFRFGPLGIVIH